MNNIDKTDITKYPIDAQAFSDQFADSMYHLAIGINRINKIINEMCSSIAETICPITTAVLVERTNALIFACDSYPKHYHYAVYSKKYRIREKYMKRILKLYRQEG